MDYDVPFEDFSEYNLIVLSRYAYNDLILSRDYNFDFSVAKENLWLTADQEQTFEDFVNDGGSLLIHHDGFGFYPKDGAITRLARSYFINHPPIGEITIKPTGDFKELNSNIEPFTVKDEEYVVEMDESQTNVFLESHSEKNGRHAQGWAHEYGGGKVVVLIPGHDSSILYHPMFKKCVTNVITWLDK
jgi:type 1 glutamine amidotransferase